MRTHVHTPTPCLVKDSLGREKSEANEENEMLEIAFEGHGGAHTPSTEGAEAAGSL